MVLAIYNSLITPFQFSFEYVQDALERQPLNTLESVIDIIYMIDIIVGFQTSYIDYVTGDEITKPKLIAKKYIGSDFTIDIISTMPLKQMWSGIVGSKPDHMVSLIFKVCKLTKVARLRKVGAMIRNLDATKESKGLMQIAFFTFALIIYTHLIACIMWYMFKTHKIWVPAVDFGAVQTRTQLKVSDLDEPWSKTQDRDWDEWDHFLY